jgi:hypothetical protein
LRSSIQTTEFINKEIAEWCKVRGVKHVSGMPYYPQSQGQVERFNQTFQTMLAANSHGNHLRWSSHVEFTTRAYNETVHRIIGLAPLVAFYVGRCDTFETAVKLGADKNFLNRVLDQYADFESLKAEVDVVVKVLSAPLAVMTCVQERLEKYAQKMVDDSLKKQAAGGDAAVNFKAGDVVRLLAPGDPREKRNILKPKHRKHASSNSALVPT